MQNKTSEDFSAEFYSEILNNISSALIASDSKGEIIWANKEALKFLSDDDSNLRGENITELFSRIKTRNKDKTNNTEKTKIEGIIPDITGNTEYIKLKNRTYEVRKTRIGPEKKILLHTLADITSLHNSGTGISGMKKIFNNIFENSGFPVAIIDENKNGESAFRIIKTNEIFKETFLPLKKNGSKGDKESVCKGIPEICNLCPERLRVVSRLKISYETDIYIESINRHFYFIMFPSFFMDQIVLLLIDITDSKNMLSFMQNSLKEKNLVLSEMHHRVKNNLQIVKSLLRMQISEEKKTDVVSALKEAESRISSMSMVHESVYESDNYSRIEVKSHFEKLFRQTIQNYSPKKEIVYIIDAEKCTFTVDTAVPLSIAINELLIYSVKNSFKESEKGRITISVKCDRNFAEIIYSDSGRHPEITEIQEILSGESERSLGTELVRNIITGQLEGEFSIEPSQEDKNNYSFKMKFPAF